MIIGCSGLACQRPSVIVLIVYFHDINVIYIIRAKGFFEYSAPMPRKKHRTTHHKHRKRPPPSKSEAPHILHPPRAAKFVPGGENQIIIDFN